MSRKTVLSLAAPIEGHQTALPQSEQRKELYSDVEKLHIFHDGMFQLKKEVNRLSFMMSEIQDVLETSTRTKRFLF